jgi:hypothetical protein
MVCVRQTQVRVKPRLGKAYKVLPMAATIMHRND